MPETEASKQAPFTHIFTAWNVFHFAFLAEVTLGSNAPWLAKSKCFCSPLRC